MAALKKRLKEMEMTPLLQLSKKLACSLVEHMSWNLEHENDFLFKGPKSWTHSGQEICFEAFLAVVSKFDGTEIRPIAGSFEITMDQIIRGQWCPGQQRTPVTLKVQWSLVPVNYDRYKCLS
ncbi:hypothetical protein FPV67DRAFT_1449978 [Lyophyllum atratum]|nr:hypothetical protein FPV67DRAFT_1449978 [Lyophyllum atratum]